MSEPPTVIPTPTDQMPAETMPSNLVPAEQVPGDPAFSDSVPEPPAQEPVPVVAPVDSGPSAPDPAPIREPVSQGSVPSDPVPGVSPPYPTVRGTAAAAPVAPTPYTSFDTSKPEGTLT